MAAKVIIRELDSEKAVLIGKPAKSGVLYVVIPKAVAEALGIDQNTKIRVEIRRL